MKQKNVPETNTTVRKKFGRHITVAVDIGSLYVKLGVWENGGKLKTFEVARRPAETNEMVALLSEWVTTHHLERQPVFSSISGQEIHVQYLTAPALKGRELTSAIKMEAEQILGEDLSHMDSDFSILNQKNEKGRIIFIAAPQILSDERVALLKSTGLNPAGLTTDGIALANGYLASGAGSEATLLLNIGYQTSNLAVVEKGEVFFVRDILWGTEQLITEIVHTTNFDLATVLGLLEKRKYSMITFPHIIDKITEPLLDELEKTLLYCQQTLELRVKKLVVTGGGSQIPSLPEFFAGRLLLELESWQILKDANELETSQRERWAPFCAVLSGLSLETESFVDIGQI